VGLEVAGGAFILGAVPAVERSGWDRLAQGVELGMRQCKAFAEDRCELAATVYNFGDGGFA
jgi:hypothetical protein